MKKKLICCPLSIVKTTLKSFAKKINISAHVVLLITYAIMIMLITLIETTRLLQTRKLCNFNQKR